MSNIYDIVVNCKNCGESVCAKEDVLAIPTWEDGIEVYDDCLFTFYGKIKTNQDTCHEGNIISIPLFSNSSVKFVAPLDYMDKEDIKPVLLTVSRFFFNGSQQHKAVLLISQEDWCRLVSNRIERKNE